MSRIKEYVKLIHKISTNEAHTLFYEFFLERAVTFTERGNIENGLAFNLAKPRDCFKNSLITNLRSKELEYYEGYYLPHRIGMPLDHAFNVKENILYDVTDQKFKIGVDEWAGVKIPNEVVSEFVKSNESDYISPLYYYYTKFILKKEVTK